MQHQGLRIRPSRPPAITHLRCSCSSTPGPATTTNARIRVRRATDANVAAVAGVASAVFGGFEFNQQQQQDQQQQHQLLTLLENRRAELVRKDVHERLATALTRKREAQRTQRALTLEQRARGLRAALEAARLGLTPAEVAAAARPGAETRAEVREREKRRRDRAFAALLATTVGEEEPAAVVGIATLSMRRPEAALPPPFPSSAPLRAYLSDMAVLPSARRSGCARLLLERACLMAKRWGEDSVWLHVAEGNSAAVALYQRAGFVRAAEGNGGGAAAVAAALAGLAAGGGQQGPQVLMVRRF